jgi:hypothetical protein
VLGAVRIFIHRHPTDFAVNREAQARGRKMPAPYKDCSRHVQTAQINTAMSAAFLRALVRLVGIRHSKTLTLPTGVANVGEIELVLRALSLIRDDRRAP